MKLTIFAGKGGVGKSTSASAYALATAERERVLVIDYDGGHSIGRIIGVGNKHSNVSVNTGIRNVSLGVVERLEYKTIAQSQREGLPVGKYLEQFKGHYGFLPLHDMVTQFFGVVTDTDTVSKMATVTTMLEEARNSGVGEVVIDVEPTAGLQRLLESTSSMVRSLKNLRNFGMKKLLLTPWPDIRAFLEGEYIKGSQRYGEELEGVAKLLQGADYRVVCIPEEGPVTQTEQVRKLVESFGGIISGYVINNLRGEATQDEQIDRIRRMAGKKKLALLEHNVSLQESNVRERRRILLELGKKILAS